MSKLLSMPERESVDHSVQASATRLVLAVGSHAGTEAPLATGYYMIGRHAECQIRPKSRSVSRRHCLLFHRDGDLQVRDLASSSGTKVNGEKVAANTWVTVGDGDELRCGKVAFEVRIGAVARQDSPKQAEAGVESRAKQASRNGSMVTGAAWDNVDIASLLDAEDEAERSERYDRIRSRNGKAKASADPSGDTTQHAEADDSDPVNVDLFADAFDDEAVDHGAFDDTPVKSPPNRTSGRQSPGHSDSTDHSKKTSAKSKAARKGSKATSKPLPRMPRKRRQRSGPRFSFAGSGDRLKFVGLCIVVVLVGALLAYQIYQFSSGPEVRVLPNLD